MAPKTWGRRRSEDMFQSLSQSMDDRKVWTYQMLAAFWALMLFLQRPVNRRDVVVCQIIIGPRKWLTSEKAIVG